MRWMGINPLAAFLAGMACMVVGFLWYSPILFAKPWMKGMGWDSVSAEQIAAAKKKAGPMYALSLFFSFLTAAVLMKFFSAIGVHTSPKALQIAGAAWLGFIMPVQATGAMFGRQKRVVFLINTAYQLVCMIASAAILAQFT